MLEELPLDFDQAEPNPASPEPGQAGVGRIEPALAAAEAEVERAARSVARLAGTMRAWRKACMEGNV